MSNRKSLLQKALRAAMCVRNQTRKDILQPICVYDVAAELGIEVRFLSVPTLEGMYSASPRPTIIIGAQRPAGRRTYTCAHELGHHMFSHGTKLDLLADKGSCPEFEEEEFLAQAFAGFLLMPKLAVLRAFTARGLRPETATPSEFFRIARFFGVGYSSLVHHLQTIALINVGRADTLRRANLATIRQELLPGVAAKSILPVDTAWAGRAVDTEIGEFLVTEKNMIVEGNNLLQISHARGGLFQAVKPGCCRLFEADGPWAAYIRVSRQGYEGRSLWRHLEEEEE